MLERVVGVQTGLALNKLIMTLPQAAARVAARPAAGGGLRARALERGAADGRRPHRHQCAGAFALEGARAPGGLLPWLSKRAQLESLSKRSVLAVLLPCTYVLVIEQ